jgi:bifunctional UDP-N-acetylglucosamine pyrophosphorylase/glucosamine-1-phosphate N-acetyltransferase
MRSPLPKVQHRFRGEPLVCHPVRAALAAGASRVVVVVGHGANEVIGTLRTAFPEAHDALCVAEQAQQLGTGHAVQCALPSLSDRTGPVLVLSGDVPLVRVETLTALCDGASRSSAGIALAIFTPPDTTGYGRIVRDAAGRIVRIVEHRDATPTERALVECNAGLYAIDADVLRRELSTLGRANSQGEIYLTDIVARLAANGDVVGLAVDPLEAAGVNSPEELSELELRARG